MVLDPWDLEGSQISAAADVEDEYETVRRQHSEKHVHIARQQSGSVEV